MISQNVNGNTSYFGYDGLGSTKFLTNQNGQITDSYQYNAYGELINQTGNTDNIYLYTGEQYDRSLNQYYLRARYYNQGVGRFTQMDSWQGLLSRPSSLNKYIYTEANPIMHIDPSGNFIMGLITNIRVRTTVSSISYGSAPSVGNVIVGGITRPLLTASRVNGLAGFTLASLISATTYNYCQEDGKCKPQIPIIFYGSNYSSLTEHISDAQMGNGSNGYPITPLLRRQIPPNSRGWLRNKLVSSVCPIPRSGLGDCDEYPFASSREGGKNNYVAGNVSLRMIDSTINQAGGRGLGRMYAEDGTQDGNRFLVLAMPDFPVSFYLTRNGKFKLF